MHKTRNVEDFDEENYKTSLENKEVLNTRKRYVMFGMKRLNLVNVSAFSDFIHSV